VSRLSRAAWTAGAPIRAALVLGIRAYRVTLGLAIGGQCRFYPSCSVYAEQAIRSRGAVRGSALAIWRILRCSPLSAGGVDHPPTSRPYDTDIQSQPSAPLTDGAR
jgi:hypothetical protein